MPSLFEKASPNTTFAVFLATLGAAVMGPATTSHLVGGRLRFPLDIVSVPLVALAIDRGLASLSALRERTRSRARPMNRAREEVE